MMIKKFSMIACINKNLALGKNNKLLYHIGGDLKNFKKLTTNNVVIMGRKTFESLPNQTPLPDRINIIVTNNKKWGIDVEKAKDNTYIVYNINDAIDICQTLFPEKEWFVIGGATLYYTFLCEDLIGKAYITEVNDDATGDAYLSKFNKDEWNIKHQDTDLTDGIYKFTYTIYEKKHF